jgi:hypothetical protein
LIWSYTALSTFLKCPRQAAHRFVYRDVPQPESDAMRFGSDVHKALEERLREGKPLTVSFVRWEPLARSVDRARRDGQGVVFEEKVAVDRSWKSTGFFSDIAWGRGVLDLAMVGNRAAVLLDWKTGKPKDDPLQLDIFAAFALARWPHLEEITAAFVWLQQDAPGKAVRYTRASIETTTIPEVTKLVDKMEQAEMTDHWPARRSPLCGWCPVTSCEHNPNR